ncbi:hypothetical protein AVEN_239715-1 [Araneus ventricosus]|uniref:Reverse transcriptase domain-containing protein n=1 Tax=Araneus ventricosus TaxID=182803 RepID=A0A4Y2VMB0_ARAVE|nr:hypothetical protein AVEN_239715-1 [Araneus ventricosus]
MPFGLINTPYFSKLIAQVLGNCEAFAVPYLDDIAIYSENWEDHLKHVDEASQRIGDANLNIQPSKCKFTQYHTKYLGHIVGREGLTTRDEEGDLLVNQEYDYPVEGKVGGAPLLEGLNKTVCSRRNGGRNWIRSLELGFRLRSTEESCVISSD